MRKLLWLLLTMTVAVSAIMYFPANALRNVLTLPIIAYPLNVDEKTFTYDYEYGPSTGYIAGRDECTILEIYDNWYCLVKYPLDSGGTKTRLAWISDFFVSDTPTTGSISGRADVYKHSTGSSTMGYVDTRDTTVWIYGFDNGRYQIVYNITGTNMYKLGWIEPFMLQYDAAHSINSSGVSARVGGYEIIKPHPNTEKSDILQYSIWRSEDEVDVYDYNNDYYSRSDHEYSGDAERLIPLRFLTGESRTSDVNGVHVKAMYPEDTNVLAILNTAINEVTSTIPEGRYAEFSTLCIGNLVSIQCINTSNVYIDVGFKPLRLMPDYDDYKCVYRTYHITGERLRLSDIISKDDLYLGVDDENAEITYDVLSSSFAENAYDTDEFAFVLTTFEGEYDCLILVISANNSTESVILYEFISWGDGETIAKKPIYDKINFSL